MLATPRDDKDAADIAWLLDDMKRHGSLDYGRNMAEDFARRAVAVDEQLNTLLNRGEDRMFLREMLTYVVERVK